MHVSKLTQKGQTTIPAEIRQKLNLHTGDGVGFEIIENQVVLKKISLFDYEYHKAIESTLSEWSSAEDDEAFNDL
jgi:antitoxin PrlF